MKRLLILSFMMIAVHVAFSQSPVNDPSYSVHNYKHPNKAAYAKKHKLDKSTVIVTSAGQQNDNYKQPFKRTKSAKKIIVRTESGKDKSNKSYKHPYGL